MCAKIPQPTSILIVEDISAMLEVLCDKFKRAGFVVYKAVNGNEGIKLAKNNKPDIILSDILMPIMDGIKMAKTLETLPETNSIPIILLSVLNNDELPSEKLTLKNILTCLWKNEMSLDDIVSCAIDCWKGKPCRYPGYRH